MVGSLGGGVAGVEDAEEEEGRVSREWEVVRRAGGGEVEGRVRRWRRGGCGGPGVCACERDECGSAATGAVDEDWNASLFAHNDSTCRFRKEQ